MTILEKNELLFKNESTFIALGFGTGLVSFAPGTIGTLVAIPFFYFSQLLPQNYDYFFVVRIKPDLKKEFRNQRMLYSDHISLERIKSTLERQSFFADLPGYITNLFLKEKIQEKQILPKGSILNGRIKMDAENFYILSSDFEEFKNVKEFLI